MEETTLKTETENTENDFKDGNEVVGKENMEKKKEEERKDTIKDRAQVYNPRTGRWVKIDTKKGGIVSQKKSPGPYKNVKKHRKRNK